MVRKVYDAGKIALHCSPDTAVSTNHRSVCLKQRAPDTFQWGVAIERVGPTSGWPNIRVSIVVSISACHADDPGSIPGRGTYQHCVYQRDFLPFELMCSDSPVGWGLLIRGRARGVSKVQKFRCSRGVACLGGNIPRARSSTLLTRHLG